MLLELAAGEGEAQFREGLLENLCPCCFYFDEGGAIVILSVDGNFQHCRYRDRGHFDFERLPTRVFLNDGKPQDFPLAQDLVPGGKPEPHPKNCNQFLASRGWDSKKAQPTKRAKKYLDETGLMVATCRHGVGLRLLNIHGTGERHGHGEALLDNIIQEAKPKAVLGCYDIACKFKKPVERLVAKHQCPIHMALGQFHMHCHRGECRILFSPLRLKGIGLTVGEDPEMWWSQAMHLVKYGRIMSAGHRTTLLDAFAISNANRQREKMGWMFNTKWERMLEVEKDYQAILSGMMARYQPNTVEGRRILIDEAYILRQMELQRVHCENFR